MSSAATLARVREAVNTRRVPRVPLAVPAEVTVLRSGIPYSIPGRSISIGERGLGLVLAGEVRPGDLVGIEFRLPDAGGPFRLKAVVRYQALLRCGLEFVNLTSEQQTLIEHWTRKKSSAPDPSNALPVGSSPVTAPLVVTPAVAPVDQKLRAEIFWRGLWILLAAMLLLGGFGWWHWYQAWSELESQIPGRQPLSQQQAPATVPAEAMQRLLTHKIEPIYPEAARQANIEGVVVLNVLVGPDGTVIDVHPISGPDELAPAAVDAVKWWRFQPYLVNGQAVQVKTTLALDFRGD
jgi:TonB family protein